MICKRTHLAIAVSSMLATPLAFGADAVYEEYNAYVDNSVDSNVSRTIDHGSASYVGVYEDFTVEGASVATVDDKQFNRDNLLSNDTVTNDAVMGDSALQNANGAIGVNVAAGDNHLQDNAVSMSALEEAEMVFADAQVLVTQAGVANITDHFDVTNTAALSDYALQNANGVVGVNVTSGSGNMQKNNVAAAIADDQLLSQATVVTIQSEELNDTYNTSVSNTASLDQYALQYASGAIGINIAAGNNNAQSNSLAMATAGLTNNN